MRKKNKKSETRKDSRKIGNGKERKWQVLFL